MTVFRYYIFLLLFSISGQLVYGQFDSPHECIENHLKNLQPESFQPYQSAESFEGTDSVLNKKLAIKLKQVLDGKGLYVIMDKVPQENNYYDSTKQASLYFLFPDKLPNIYVKKGSSGWFYPKSIHSWIEQHHKEVYPLGTNLLVNRMPENFDIKFLGLRLWQWIAICILLVASVIIFWFLRKILGFITRQFNNSTFKIFRSQAVLFQRILSLISLFLTIRIVLFFLPTLQLHPQLSAFAILLLKIISALLILLMVLRIVDILYEYFFELTERTSSKMDEQLMPVIKKTVQLVLVSLWVVYLLTLFNVDVTAMLAGISIGGLAIALAAQDTIKNLFGSITIFTDQPFQIGDWIKSENVEGTVEEIGFRSTRIRSFENSLMSIPNARLIDSSVNNFGLRRYRRFKTNISIEYNTPLPKIEKFIAGLKELINIHPNIAQDAGNQIALNDMSSSSLDILFYVFFDVEDWTGELQSRQDIIFGIIGLAECLDINFAFPSMSIYTSAKNKASLDNIDSNKEYELFLKDYSSRINP